MKIYVIDFETPRWLRKTIAYVVPGLLAAGIGIAYASPKLDWTTGQPLLAKDLRDSFKDVDDRLKLLEGATPSVIPPGTIVAWGADCDNTKTAGQGGPPAGWLCCDGTPQQRSGTYNPLFLAISIAWGGGDGVNTFNLPDLKGRFLRGVDHGAGRDPDATTRIVSVVGRDPKAVGSMQPDQFKEHLHRMSFYGNTTIWGPGINEARADNGNAGTWVTKDTTFSGGSETRPQNAYVEYIIKY